MLTSAIITTLQEFGFSQVTQDYYKYNMQTFRMRGSYITTAYAIFQYVSTEIESDKMNISQYYKLQRQNKICNNYYKNYNNLKVTIT